MLTSSNSNNLQEFFLQFEEKSFQPEDQLLPLDESLNYVLYLKQGYVRQFAVSDQGEEFTLNFFKPGSFFPLNLILHDQPNPYYFVGHTAGVYTPVPKNKIIAELQANNQVMFDLLQRITSGINGMLVRFQSLVFGNARQKIAGALYLSYLRFGQLSKSEDNLCNKESEKQTVIDLNLTHEQLGFLTGLTRESVSQEMIKLKQEKLINYKRKKICVLDPEKLKQISSLPFYA